MLKERLNEGQRAIRGVILSAANSLELCPVDDKVSFERVVEFGLEEDVVEVFFERLDEDPSNSAVALGLARLLDEVCLNYRIDSPPEEVLWLQGVFLRAGVVFREDGDEIFLEAKRVFETAREEAPHIRRDRIVEAIHGQPSNALEELLDELDRITRNANDAGELREITGKTPELGPKLAELIARNNGWRWQGLSGGRVVDFLKKMAPLADYWVVLGVVKALNQVIPGRLNDRVLEFTESICRPDKVTPELVLEIIEIEAGLILFPDSDKSGYSQSETRERIKGFLDGYKMPWEEESEFSLEELSEKDQVNLLVWASQKNPEWVWEEVDGGLRWKVMQKELGLENELLILRAAALAYGNMSEEDRTQDGAIAIYKASPGTSSYLKEAGVVIEGDLKEEIERIDNERLREWKGGVKKLICEQELYSAYEMAINPPLPLDKEGALAKEAIKTSGGFRKEIFFKQELPDNDRVKIVERLDRDLNWLEGDDVKTLARNKSIGARVIAAFVFKLAGSEDEVSLEELGDWLEGAFVDTLREALSEVVPSLSEGEAIGSILEITRGVASVWSQKTGPTKLDEVGRETASLIVGFHQSGVWTE